MNNKQFKKILKESLSNGADVFFEEEEIPSSIASGPDMDEDPDKEAKEDTIESQTINNLKSAASDAETIKKSGKMVPDEFARTVAYYFIGMYHDENESWNLSLRNNSIFNRNLEAVLESIEERDDNILCKFSEVLDWVTTFGAYVSPDIFVASVRTQKNEATLNKINKVLVDIKKGNFSLSSGNRKILNRLVEKAGKDFDLSRCPQGSAEKSEPEKTSTEEPNNLETPTTPQTLKAFSRELNKIPQLENLSDILIDALTMDLGELADAVMRGAVISKDDAKVDLDEQDKKSNKLLKDINNVRNSLEQVKAIRTPQLAQIILLFIRRFLARNNIILSKNAKMQLDGLNLNPKNEKDALGVLRNVRGKNLEEQRYNMLLKRFDIK